MITKLEEKIHSLLDSWWFIAPALAFACWLVYNSAMKVIS